MGIVIWWISRESLSERFLHKLIDTIDIHDTRIVTNETELSDQNVLLDPAIEG